MPYSMMSPRSSAENYAASTSKTRGESGDGVDSSNDPLVQPSFGPRNWLALAITLTALLLLVWSTIFGARPAVLHALRIAYGIYDPFTQEDTIDFGPPVDHKLVHEPRAMERVFGEHFPDYSFKVEVSAAIPSDQGRVIFQHESLTDPEVVEFLKLADPVINGSRDVFEIASRVRGMTEHGRATVAFDDNNPVEIMRVAQLGEPLTCRPFSLLFGACVVEKGYSSRLLGLSKDGRKFDHAVTEVFVPDFRKWIVIDTDFNIAYRRRGEWLSAAELHDLWTELSRRHPDKRLREELYDAVDPAVTRDIREVLQVEVIVLGETGEPLRQNNLALHGTGIGLEFYEYVVYHARNNFLGAEYPKGHPKRSLQYVIQPLGESRSPAMCPEATPAPSRESLYFPVGRTQISLDHVDEEEEIISLRLATWTPNFSHFESRDDQGEWRVHSSNQVQFHWQPGVHLVEARSVNLAGLRGETASWRVETARQRPADSAVELSP
jgi:hypothetical protein